jgi:hypothetical protein
MIKFGYFVVRGIKDRFAVVAIDCPPKDSDSLYKVSFAFCSRKDNFLKKRGRQIAEGRLRVNDCVLVSPLKEKHTISDIIAEAVEVMVDEGYTPSWFSRAYTNKRLIWGLNPNKGKIISEYDSLILPAIKKVDDEGLNLLKEWKKNAKDLIDVRFCLGNNKGNLKELEADAAVLLEGNGEDISEIEDL